MPRGTPQHTKKGDSHLFSRKKGTTGRSPARAAGFDKVRAAAAGLPDVEEGTAYGAPAIKLHGRLLACIASNKAAEPNTLVIRVSFDQRDAMIADDPDTYYLKDHYVGYPCVLVRLARIHPDALRDLLHAGWRFVSATVPARRAERTPQRHNSQRPINTQRPTPKMPKVRSRRVKP
jgi:hypothetical protein